jgi:hypothetical protein
MGLTLTFSVLAVMAETLQLYLPSWSYRVVIAELIGWPLVQNMDQKSNGGKN